ncbi:MAG: DedA family protein [Proteobacteria bacterium]|nr:DedA family protein [Pseudomonadota bacterium]
MFKKLKEKILHYAEKKHGSAILFLNSFTESSFFPIPPDLLQMALSFINPRKSIFYAFLSTIASVLGGILGYFIGVYLMDYIGMPIINFYKLQSQFETVKGMYYEKDVWIVFTAAFTPIPYKLITITAGAVRLNIINFILASAIGRAMRFFLVGLSIYFFGEKVKPVLVKYLNLLTILFFVLLVLGFVVIKYLVK